MTNKTKLQKKMEKECFELERRRENFLSEFEKLCRKYNMTIHAVAGQGVTLYEADGTMIDRTIDNLKNNRIEE